LIQNTWSANDPAGHRKFIKWATKHGKPVRVYPQQRTFIAHGRASFIGLFLSRSKRAERGGNAA
jgi:hypothetical protein